MAEDHTETNDKESAGNLERAIQLLQVLERIPEKSDITCQQLRAELAEIGIEMSTRKIQRYMEALSGHEFFDIRCNNTGKPYGYRRASRLFSLGTCKLDAADSLLLRLAQEHLAYQMPPKITRGLHPLFDEAHHYLNEPTHGREKKWLNKVAIVGNSVAFRPANIRQSVFEAVAEAIYNDLQIDVTYFSGAAMTEKTHRVSPLGIVQQDVRIYLVCQFEGHEDFRSIAMHRIKSVRISTFPSKRPKNFDLKSYVKYEKIFNYDRGHWVEFSFDFTNPVTKMILEETPFEGKGQRITELPDNQGWHLQAIVRDSRLLDGWIAMWQVDAGITNVQKHKTDAP